ncbi:MAG: DUF6808 domain-containing protein [Agathobacter sp.]
MEKKIHIIYLSIIVVLAILSFIGFSRNERKVDSVIEKTDTLITTKVDTIMMTDIRYVEKKVVDTVYVRSIGGEQSSLPMYDYRFRKDGIYDITAYGYGVLLKSVSVYPETKTYMITNTTEKVIEKKSWDVYLGAGITAYDNAVIPSINLTVKTPNRWLFGANIGYGAYGLSYGCMVSYRLDKN